MTRNPFMNNFANLLTVLGIAGIITCLLIFYLAHKRGVDTLSYKFQLRVFLGCGLVFGIIPLFFSDLSLFDKIIGSLIALSGGLLNYFGIDRIQKKLSDLHKK